MSKVLVKYRDNYSDEFDVEGFAVDDADEWQKHLKLIEEAFKDNPGASIECWFGTNEAITYESYDDYVEAFEVTPITDAEAATLEKLFGGGSFGTFLTIEP